MSQPTLYISERSASVVAKTFLTMYARWEHASITKRVQRDADTREVVEGFAVKLCDRWGGFRYV